MYMPYTAPSDLGEMLQGWITPLFAGVGIAGGFYYAPQSDLLICVALIGWGLATIQVHRMEDDGEAEPSRLKFLGLFATPALILFMNGLLDNRESLVVDVAVVDIGTFGYQRLGYKVDTEFHALSPDAPVQIVHCPESVERVHLGLPAQVYLHKGAFGLLWGQRVVLNPTPPARKAAP